MAFEELDARVIGSSITVRLEETLGGVGLSPSPQPRATAAKPTPPRAGTLPPAPKPEAQLATPEEDSRPSRSGVAKKGQHKGAGLFVMKPLSAERLRVALTVGSVGAIVLVAGSIYVHDGWKFFKGFLPVAHVEAKATASTNVPHSLVAGGPVTQQVASAPVATAPMAAAVAPQAAVVAPAQPSPPAEVRSQAAAPQQAVSAPAAIQPAPASAVVETQQIKKVEVQPVPQAVIERAPLVPLPAAPKPVRPRVAHQEAAPRPQQHEAPAAEQNSPILVGGQFSKGKESK